MVTQLVTSLREKQADLQERPLIVAISGFGGSGKSYLAQQLQQELEDAERTRFFQ